MLTQWNTFFQKTDWFSKFPHLKCKKIKFLLLTFRTSLFKGCSALYSLLLVTVCMAFLVSEIATNSVPLHYFEVSFYFKRYLNEVSFFYRSELLIFCFFSYYQFSHEQLLSLFLTEKQMKNDAL